MNEENLLDSIRGLEGIEITLFLEENKTVEGTLLSVQKDYLIVKEKEKILYFPINQIKALSKSAKESKITKGLSDHLPMNSVLLEELLANMVLQWITVNSIDEQKFSGVLSKIAEDYILLLNGEKQFFVLKSRITDIVNEQIDENQIENLQSNASIQSEPAIMSEIQTNTVNSNLQQTILDEQQRNELAEVAKKKFRRLAKSNVARNLLQKHLSEAQPLLENESNVEIEENLETTIVENIEPQLEMTLENESNLPVEENTTIQIVNDNVELLQTTTENETNLPIQSIKCQQQSTSENVATHCLTNSTTKKPVKIPFLQELKYNSPLEKCTWNERDDEDHFPFQHVKEEQNFTMTESQEALQETVEHDDAQEQSLVSVEIKDSVPSNTIQLVSQELVTVEQNQKEFNNDEVETLVMEENSEKSFEHGSIKMLMEDNRRLLQCQYFALMKFAERMYHLENQYKTIMKHAEKMYMQLKERRFY